MGPEEEISDVVETVSFDESLGEIEGVVEGGLSEDRVITVNSVEMYEVIPDFEREIGTHRTACVDTKYKTVDGKVKPVSSPSSEGSRERIKGSLPT